MKRLINKIKETIKAILNTKKSIIFILLIYLLQGIIHNLGHPITPYLISELGIPDYMFGVFFATMSLGLMLGGPVWGTLGDHSHKKRYIVIGLLVYGFGQYMFGNVGNQYWMVFFRFVSGFGVAASAALLIGILICESGKENRTKYIGFSVAAFTLGASIGYKIAGMLGKNEFFTKLLEPNLFGNIFLIQAIANTILALFVYLVLRNIKVVTNGDKKPSLIQGFKDIKTLDSTLKIFLLSLTFISIGMINVSKFLDIYFEYLGYDTKQLGDFVFYTGLVSLFASIIVVPIIVKLKKDMKIMIYMQIISMIIIIIVFRSSNIMLMLYSLFMIYVFVKAIYGPLEQSFISGYATEGKYGALMGVRQAYFAVGLVIGPLVAGVLYHINPLYVFDFSVIMFGLGCILLIFVNIRIKKENNIESI